MPNPIMDVLYGNPLQNFARGGQPGTTGGLVGALMGLGAGGQPQGGQGGPAASPMAPAQATQSPGDLVRLYAQLEQRDRAEDMFNTGAANLVASRTPGFKQPAMPATPNAGAELQNLMTLQQGQVAMQQQAQLRAAAPALGKLLGMEGDTSILSALPPDALSSIVQQHMKTLEPTDAVRNYNQARDLMKRQGLGDDVINQVMPPEMIALGGITDPGYREFALARARAIQSGQPLSPELQDYSSYLASKAQQVKIATDRGADIADARTGLASYNSSLDDMENRVGRIADAGPVLAGILSDPTKKIVATKIINAEPGSSAAILAQYGHVLSQAEINALDEIRQLHLQNYASNFKSGQRLTQTEAARLGVAADQLSNFDLSPENYTKQLGLLQGKIQTARANAFGAAQDFNSLPVELRPKLDKSYLPGGVNAPPGATMPEWAKPVDVATPEDYDRVPYGQAYRPQSGKYAGKVLYKGLEDQFKE